MHQVLTLMGSQQGVLPAEINVSPGRVPKAEVGEDNLFRCFIREKCIQYSAVPLPGYLEGVCRLRVSGL